MAVYHVNGPNGEVYEVTAPDNASQDQVIAFARQQAQKAPAQPKPKGYDAAIADLKQRDALQHKTSFMPGLGDWEHQVAANTGALDEAAGGVNYLMQGAGNLFRRATGQPIEIPAAVAGKAAIDYERQKQQQYAQQHPTANVFATAATLATSAKPVAGAAILTNPFRAGAAAAAQNAPFALARQQGSIPQRLPGAAKEEAVTFGLGAGATALGGALGASAAHARANPSAARKLSAQGVDLTPGQMAGGLGQRVEDAATSLPLTGAAINAARTRGIDDFNRAVANDALAPIREKLASTTPVGREALKETTAKISDAYDKALSGVTVAPDSQFASEVSAVKVPASLQSDFDAIKQDMLSHLGSTTDGQTWKAVDSQLGAFYRAADNASAQQPVQRFLRDAIGKLRDAHAGLLDRTAPQAAASVKLADQATARLARLRQASQNAATATRGGAILPSELNRAALSMDTSAGNRAFATGDAVGQNLTEPAMQVLPSKIPDSGTALRAVTAGSVYGGTSATLGPHAGMTAIAADLTGAALYSKPAMAMLNAVYRATSPGQARAALSKLAVAAARDPALAPAYESALRRLGLQPASSGGPQGAPQGQPSPMSR